MYNAILANAQTTFDTPVFAPHPGKSISPLSTNISPEAFRYLVNRQTLHLFCIDGAHGLDGTNLGIDSLRQSATSDGNVNVTYDTLSPGIMMNARSPDTILKDNLLRVKDRGQINSAAAMQASRVERWENFSFDSNNQAGARGFISSVPIVTTVTHVSGGKDDRTVLRKVGTFVACYSNFEPTHSKNANQGLLVDPPVWKDMFVNRLQGPNMPKQARIFVDANCIGDTSALYSLAAALENTHPLADTYVYAVPYFADKEFGVGGLFPTSKSRAIHGASAGISFAMAVMGALPVYYTGYLENILYGTKMMSNYKAKSAAPDYQVYPSTSGISPEHASSVNVGGQQIPGLVKVVAQFNMVEKVDSIVAKMSYLTFHNVPFVFPATTDLKGDMASFIYRNENKQYLYNWLNMVPDIYTLAKATDGQPMLQSRPNGTFLTTNAAGITFDDFTTLQALFLRAILVTDYQYAGPWNDETYKAAQDALIKGYANSNTATQERLKVYRSQLKTAKENADSEAAWQKAREQITADMKAQTKQRNERAAQASKARRKKITSGSQSLKEQKAEIKNRIEQLRASANYLKMTKAQKKAFSKANKEIIKSLTEKNVSQRYRVVNDILAPIMQEINKKQSRGMGAGFLAMRQGYWNKIHQAAKQMDMSDAQAAKLADNIAQPMKHWQDRYEQQKQEGTTAEQTGGGASSPAAFSDNNDNNTGDKFDDALNTKPKKAIRNRGLDIFDAKPRQVTTDLDLSQKTAQNLVSSAKSRPSVGAEATQARYRQIEADRENDRHSLMAARRRGDDDFTLPPPVPRNVPQHPNSQVTMDDIFGTAPSQQPTNQKPIDPFAFIPNGI